MGGCVPGVYPCWGGVPGGYPGWVCVSPVCTPDGCVSPVCTPDGCGVFAGEVSLVGQEVEVFRCYTRPWFSAVVSDHNLITGALTIMDANVLMPYTLERSKVQIRLPQGVKGERGGREGGRGGEGVEGGAGRVGHGGEGV